MAKRINKTLNQLLDELRAQSVPENRLGMARFGIDTSNALGISMPNIRAIGATTKKSHALAVELWASQIHEARILASLVDIVEDVTPQQMDHWVGDFNSWDLCDQVCGNLFDRTAFAQDKILDWKDDPREFVKRAAFAMIAWQAVHLKAEPDETFLNHLQFIPAAASDDRNFVRKAVNWALRQIGKRNKKLHGPARQLASELAASDNKTAAWIGKNAYDELASEKVRHRLALA
ncbi:MAG: DNA alkylation repair protein [Salaquimonas sp.]